MRGYGINRQKAAGIRSVPAAFRGISSRALFFICSDTFPGQPFIQLVAGCR
ncbi:MAG: hypothetical protein BWZ01_00965 [Deltaproteobacteria bacterium ADurb.BinA179]|nr:MAG: hypothetical protein BWZ01_00965 [Deltaproteobacteria bacterium ADurb.BinA179]